MQIEPATKADIPEVAALWHTGWHQGHATLVPEALVASRVPEEFIARSTKWIDHTFVGREEGEFAGFYMLKDAEIYQFYVAAAFQGQGVAGGLMASAEAALSGQEAWLACTVGNDRAAGFYAKAGWARGAEVVYPVETSTGQAEVTVWRYEKDLRQPA